MSSDARDGDAGSVTLQREGDWFVARDEQTGVASQGETRAEALENLAEALELHEEPISTDTGGDAPDTPWFDNNR